MASESAIGSVIGDSTFSRSSVTELVVIHIHCTCTTVPKLCTITSGLHVYSCTVTIACGRVHTVLQ